MIVVWLYIMDVLTIAAGTMHVADVAYLGVTSCILAVGILLHSRMVSIDKVRSALLVTANVGYCQCLVSQPTQLLCAAYILKHTICVND